MFTIKSEPSDTVAVDNDSQYIRFMEENQHASDSFNMNASKIETDASLGRRNGVNASLC